MHPTAPRTIGQTGITLSPLVFGGNVFGWTADKAASLAMLDRLLDAGRTSIDTADVYSRWVPGNQGRRVGDDPRRVDAVARRA